MASPPLWVVTTPGGASWRRHSLSAAIRSADHPYTAGLVHILNARSGERWERRAGIWIKTAPGLAKPARHRPAAGAAPQPRNAG